MERLRLQQRRRVPAHTGRCVHSSPFSSSISIYKSSPDAKKVRLQQFFTPDKATVMSLACTPRSLYAGLVDGAVAVYAKAQGEGAMWVGQCHSPRHRLSLTHRHALSGFWGWEPEARVPQVQGLVRLLPTCS